MKQTHGRNVLCFILLYIWVLWKCFPLQVNIQVKPLHSGCWTLTGLSPISDVVCDFHGQDLKAQPLGRKCPVWEPHCSLQMTWFCWLLRPVTSSRFAVECEAIGMRVSTSKSEAMVPCRKMVDCPLRLAGVPKQRSSSVLGSCPWVMGKQSRRRTGGLVRHLQYCKCCTGPTWWEKAEPGGDRINLPVYLCSDPLLTYGQKLWVVTERARSQIQVAKISFLCRVAWLSLSERVRGLVIHKELGVQPLLLCVERCLPWELYRERPTRRRPQGRPRTHWRDYISYLAWERLRILRSSLGLPPEDTSTCRPGIEPATFQ